MHFVLYSSKWILHLLSTNHSHKLVKSLFNWCSIVWTFLCWYVKPESSAYKNKSEWTAWGILLACSKNRRGSKVDPWKTPQVILDKSEKCLFILTLNARCDKCDLNHAIAFSGKPIACYLRRTISWFIVSAFWRSISIIPVESLLSKPFSILSLTKGRQKSVEWCFLYCDWYLYNILLWSKKLSTW